jgi:hypothetical protein
MRGRANGWAVVPGDVDDRHRNVRFFETVPQRDTRDIAQVDVENDANHPVKIAVICEGFRRRKQHAFVAQLPQQSRYAPQHHGVVIDVRIRRRPLGRSLWADSRLRSGGVSDALRAPIPWQEFVNALGGCVSAWVSTMIGVGVPSSHLAKSMA